MYCTIWATFRRRGGGGAGRWSGAHTLSHRDFHFRCTFSGYRRSIFECFHIIRFVFPLAFQCQIQNCSTAKTREEIVKRKRKVENYDSAFFIFWIRSNIFCDFSGCFCSILISEKIIRFVFLLAFQCPIPKYSTAKTFEDIAKRKWKTMIRLFFIIEFVQTYFAIYRATDVRFLNVFISLDLSFH